MNLHDFYEILCINNLKSNDIIFCFHYREYFSSIFHCDMDFSLSMQELFNGKDSISMVLSGILFLLC